MQILGKFILKVRLGTACSWAPYEDSYILLSRLPVIGDGLVQCTYIQYT